MNTVNNQGSCWPTWQQELLLQASLLRGREAISAWEKWKSSVNIEQLDPGSFRLLPLLYYNLNTHGVNDATTNKLKGVYRQTWYQNQLLFHRVVSLLSSLHNAGIETMLLKGAALILLYYENHGLRPMGDIDVLVRTKQAATAIELLKGINWTAEMESPERLIPIAHGTDFKNASGQVVDLHWHVIHECLQENADDDFWESAVPIEINNLSTHALNPTDQLLHVCAHGIKWGSAPPFRWLADAATIINSSQSGIDWARLIAHIERRRLILPVRDTLNYLSDKLAVPIPEDTLRIIRNMRTTRMEQVEYSYKSQDYLEKPLGYLPILWFDYSRLSGNSGLPLKLVGFVKHMQSYWGARRLWQLPFYAMSMTKNRIRAFIDYYGKQSQ